MALTSEDLRNIDNLVSKAVSTLPTREYLDAKLGHMEFSIDTKLVALDTKLDRMESRIVTSIDLLQRDAMHRLDNHESRITSLEQDR